MPLTPELRQRLDALVHSNNIVLFMKGNRHFPQCGFSAQVVKLLESAGARSYETVNVLADPEVRDGMKELSQWPTFPQLYVGGELVGGCDIVKELHASGELAKLVGGAAGEGAASGPAAEPAARAATPSITLTESAAKALRDASEDAAGDVLHLEISTSFENDLFFAPKKSGDIVASASGVDIHMDAATAGRAAGLAIDFIQGTGGAGFKLTNPNEPPRVKPLRAKELEAMLAKGDVELFDVRPENERERAKIDAAKPLADDDAQKYLAGLPKDRAIALHCHHGIRSRHAAEQLLLKGYTNVYNLEGGIAAWSADVDARVPRY